MKQMKHSRILKPIAALLMAPLLGLIPSCALFRTEEMSLLDNLELLQKLGTLSGYRVGGLITGLPAGASVTLSLNGANAQTFTANGPFYMSTRLGDGAAYTLSVSTQPYGQASAVEAGCLVDPATGTIPGGDVSVIYVSCGMLGWRTLAGMPATFINSTVAGDMAIHSNGDIDVAYADNTASPAGVWSYRYSNGAWVMLASTLTAACTPAQGCSAIELDRNGLPYLAVVNGMSHWVYSLAGGSWNALALPAQYPGLTANSPGLAFRASNLPTLTSVNAGAVTFRIQDYDGANWYATSPSTANATSSASHPVVDSADHVWTAVCENTGGQITVFRDSTPSSAPAFGASCTTIGSFDLAMGPDGTAYLVYVISTTVYLQKSADNVTWTQVATFTGAAPSKAFVNVDSSGRVNVGYLDGSTLYLRAARGSSWVGSTIAMSSSTPLRMRLKPDGLPCVFSGTGGATPSVSCYGP